MATRGATIVVVEQSAGAMELIDQALRDTADRVLITQSPPEVLDVADRIRIDLLVIYLADRHLRPTLVDEIRSSQPELRVLYIRDHTEERPPGDDGDGALRTPFSIDELREAVAARLDRIPEAAS
jgi:DNA-binding response OmpR family regulator